MYLVFSYILFSIYERVQNVILYKFLSGLLSIYNSTSCIDYWVQEFSNITVLPWCPLRSDRSDRRIYNTKDKQSRLRQKYRHSVTRTRKSVENARLDLKSTPDGAENLQSDSDINNNRLTIISRCASSMRDDKMCLSSKPQIRIKSAWPIVADWGRLRPIEADLGRLRPIEADCGRFS